MALVGVILEQGGFREALNQLGVTDKRSGNQMRDGDLNSGFAVWAGRISRRFMRWTATRNFMSFVWARSVRLRKQPCAGGWIKQEKADAGRFSRRMRKRSRNGVRPSPLSNGYVPADMDVTPLDNSKTKKEGVSRAYKGFDGYAPNIGTSGIF